MNSISNNDADIQNTMFIDAQAALAPVNILMLEKAIKASNADVQVFALKTEDALCEENLQSFCKTSGHHYLHHAEVDGENVYYVRKGVLAAKKSCFMSTCYNIRTVLSAFAVVGTVAYTLPFATISNPPLFMTMAFAIALGFVPPVIYSNVALFTKIWRKRSFDKVRANNPI